MAHYSEMSFLFDGSGAESVTQILDANSMDNTSNVVRGDDYHYVVYKNKKNTNTNEIKQYLGDSIYKRENTGNRGERNPYLRLLDDFKSSPGLRINAADLAYLRELGVYPINRLAILRRFPEGSFVTENLEEMNTSPISTIVGWVKADENFGKINFNETWTKTNKRFDVLLNELVQRNFGGINISAMVPIPDFAQGILFEFYKRAGLAGGNNQDSVDEVIESYSGELQGDNWGLSNIPVGDPNVLQEAPYRDPFSQNIQSDFTFELKTTYEQKLLGSVDPGSAMLDIIDNIFAMGTSNMLFYWNDESPIINKARIANSGEANSPAAWWKFMQEVLKSFWEGLKDLFNDVRTEIEKVVEKSKKSAEESKSSQKTEENKNSTLNNIADNVQNAVSGAKSDAGKGLIGITKGFLQTLLTSTLSIYRFQTRGTLELMVGGKYSSTPWHLTIGNPYSPWLSTNHIIVKSCYVETSTELAFNDQPQWITATFNCEFSRSLGKQELMRMFNNTYRRTYSEPLDSSDQETKTDIYGRPI